jgi:hypothetical protein
MAELRRHHAVRLLETISAYGEFLGHSNATHRNYGAASVLLEMSDALAHVIALAAGEPDRISEAASLPIGLQLQALGTILTLSLTGDLLSGLAPPMVDFLTRLETIRPEEIN